MDIIVTSPKHLMAEATREAADLIRMGGGQYWHHTRRIPSDKCGPGDRIYYVEDGYIRGFSVIVFITDAGPGSDVVSDAETWQWIEPVEMKGFRGFRYWSGPRPRVIGDWLDPKPEVKQQDGQH